MNYRKTYYCILWTFIFFCSFSKVSAQEKESNSLKWIRLEELPKLPFQGQLQVDAERLGVGRLPISQKDSFRAAVWNLAQHTAGLYLEFKTNASKLNFSYKTTGALQMPHMPATGVSGLDLYRKRPGLSWEWVPAKYAFRDTISYQYEKLVHEEETIYRLYLPLLMGLNFCILV